MSDTEDKQKEEEIVVKEAPESASEPEEEADDEISPDVGIEALKNQLEMERQARAEAERRAKMAESTASKASMEVQDSNLQLIASAIESVNRTSQMMKRDYAAAMAAGNYEQAAEIQSHMSLNAAKLLQLENGKAALEQRIANPPPKQPSAPMDQVEEVASQLSPRSAAWVRAHPECVRDQKLYLRMVGAHNIAISNGYVPDSDAYFEQIEQQMGFRKPQTTVSRQEIEEPTSMAAKPMAPKAPPPAAPSSRAASNGSGGRHTVTLNKDQREMAAIMGMTPEEYAKNMTALKKEGKMQ